MDVVLRDERQLGDALRRLRRQAGLTQEALGARAGLRQATISKLESGAEATRLSTLVAVLTALGQELVLRDRTAENPLSLEDLF